MPAESVQLALELFDGRGGFLGGEPIFLGLLQAFDLPAGLRVVPAGVVLPDPALAEFDLEGDAPFATRFAGEDRAVEFLRDVKPPRIA